MLRKKSIYRKELAAYMCVSDLCARFKKVDILHKWCRNSMISSLTQILTKFDWIDQDWDWDWASSN